MLGRESLLAAARAAAARAYAPYSHFRVGAAVQVETPKGTLLVTGANVENASYGLTLCAERSALAAACTLDMTAFTTGEGGGERQPRVLAVAVACVDVPPDAPASARSPCGACRQWLAELAPDAVYYVDGIPGELRLPDLLPNAFRLDG
jgi:cytidine deaminase